MAFAPPRRSRQELSLSTRSSATATRLPVPSPAKKSQDITPEADGLKDTKPVRHVARTIPSRYLQESGARGLNRNASPRRAGLDKSGPTQATRRDQSVAEHGGSTKLAAARSVATTQARTSRPSKAEDEALKDLLQLRIMQTLETCDTGDKAFARYKASAERQLTEKWERAREHNLQDEMAAQASSMRVDAQELADLSSSEVFILENFIERVQETEKEMRRLSQSFDDWSVDVLGPIHAAWREAVNSQALSCKSTMAGISPLRQRLNSSDTSGVVKTAVMAFCTLLDELEQEGRSLEAASQALWQRKVLDVDEEFSKLQLQPAPLDERERSFAWDEI